MFGSGGFISVDVGGDIDVVIVFDRSFMCYIKFLNGNGNFGVGGLMFYWEVVSLSLVLLLMIMWLLLV